MNLTKTAADYLVGKESPTNIEENRIYRLFRLNGYDPAYGGSILLGWCQKDSGKRNTLWVFGPVTTGKTNIVEASLMLYAFTGV